MSVEKSESSEIAVPEAGQPASREFLNPKSMLTPGVCGGITMLITNTLVAQFGAPANYTGLIISCVLGGIVFASTAAVWWLRGIYWVLNSLIIFSIALGSNQIGAATAMGGESKPAQSVATNSVTGPEHVTPPIVKRAFFASWIRTEKPVAAATQISNENLQQLSKAVAEYYAREHTARPGTVSSNEVYKAMSTYLVTNRMLVAPRISK